MRKIAIALAVSVLTAAPAFASDRSDIMAVLNHWITGEAGVTDTCTDDAAVIDDFPPFEWHGPGACATWQKDNEADMQREGITGGSGTIGTPHQFTISNDRAYVVLPSTFSVTQKGKLVTEIGTSTVVLKKTAAGWKIAAWTWSTLKTQ